MSEKYAVDEPEGSTKRGHQYISKRDAFLIAGVLIVLGALFTPVFLKMRRDSWKKQCSGNIQEISKAMFLYAAQHDDRFPPLYVASSNGLPMEVNGSPWTWATDIEPNMSERGDFGCPAATPEEHCSIYSQEKKGGVPMAYGMYAGMAAEPAGLLHDPSTIGLISETSNNGAGGTYNPVPLVGFDGKTVRNDGFLIGWNNKPNGNREFDETTEFVTRLAFKGTSSGDFFDKKVKPRHEPGIHLIYADGHMGIINAAQARVKHLSPELIGIWGTD